MGCESFDVVRFDLITRLLLVLEVCNVKQRNIIMGWQSFDVDRFDLGYLLIYLLTCPLAFHIKLQTVGTFCFCLVYNGS